MRSPVAVPSADVTRTLSQWNASRRVVTIEWIANVRSGQYQTTKTTASSRPRTDEERADDDGHAVEAEFRLRSMSGTLDESAGSVTCPDLMTCT
jgi:hypothetical protein